MRKCGRPSRPCLRSRSRSTTKCSRAPCMTSVGHLCGLTRRLTLAPKAQRARTPWSTPVWDAGVGGAVFVPGCPESMSVFRRATPFSLFCGMVSVFTTSTLTATGNSSVDQPYMLLDCGASFSTTIFRRVSIASSTRGGTNPHRPRVRG